MKRKIGLLYFACALFSMPLIAQDLNLSKWIQPVPESARFSLPDYMVWCGSMIKGEDGKYYLFYSRWPRSMGHYAWVTDSEIALARADNPTGPYKHMMVVLGKRDNHFWDGACTHNPTIHKFQGKYYLYYMGTTGTSNIQMPTSMNDPNWWEYRNNQRIGVAVSSKILGPWIRSEKPLIDTTTNGFDHLVANNPSVVRRPDGRYLMIYKGVGKGKMPYGGKVLHGAALADKPEGPFIKLPQRIFVKDSTNFAAEDPYIWYQKGKYYAIVKDMKGVFTNAGTSLALFESKDGLDWKPSKNVLVSTCQIPWFSGIKKVTKLERPQFWMDNGIPKVLFCAVYDGENNYNVAIPLKKH